MSGKGQPYAFETSGCVSAIPIALWCTQGRHVPVDESKPDGATRFELGFEPIQGAFVTCVQMSEGSASVAIDLTQHVRSGKTNQRGWVVKRSRSEMGEQGEVPEHPWKAQAPPEDGSFWTALFGKLPGLIPVVFEQGEPCADRKLLAGLPNEDYAIFWTYDKELFEAFTRELEHDPHGTLDTWGVPRHTMQPFGIPEPLPNFGVLSDDQRGKARRLLFPGERRGYHAGWYFKALRTAAIFDATPPCLRALYASEWLQDCYEQLLQQDWPHLHSLLGVIRAAEGGNPIPDLAKVLPAGGEVGERVAQMRRYVYEVAEARFRDRWEVANAVRNISLGPGGTGPGGWTGAAEYLREETKNQRAEMGKPELVHPANGARNFDVFNFPSHVEDALIAHYDLYALGFDRAQDGPAVAAHWGDVQERLGWVRTQQVELLRAAGHVALMRAVAANISPDATDLRLDLAERYHFQCAALGLEFWKDADVELQRQSDWDRMAPCLAWLAADATLMEKLTDGLIKHHVSVYRDLSHESVETFVRYFYRYHLTLQQKSADHTFPRATGTVSLELDGAAQRVLARVYGPGKVQVLAELELLTEVHAMPEDELHAPLGAHRTGAQRTRYRRAARKGQARAFEQLAERRVTLPDAEGLSGFPLALATSAELLSATVAVKALVDEVHAKGFSGVQTKLFWDAGESALALTGTGSNVAELAFQRAGIQPGRAASRFVRGAGVLGKTAVVAAAVRNVAAGGETLATVLSPHTSRTELAKYLDRGETVPAWLEGTKGVLQVATGAGGAASLVVGASTTVAAASLGVWLAVGGLAIATLDVAIYVTTGGGSPVDPFLQAVMDARRSQFRQDDEGRILFPDETCQHQSAGRSTFKTRLAKSRVSRQLASLNALAKAAVINLRG